MNVMNKKSEKKKWKTMSWLELTDYYRVVSWHTRVITIMIIFVPFFFLFSFEIYYSYCICMYLFTRLFDSSVNIYISPITYYVLRQLCIFYSTRPEIWGPDSVLTGPDVSNLVLEHQGTSTWSTISLTTWISSTFWTTLTTVSIWMSVVL